MHDLGDFSLRDMAECTARVRRLGDGAGSMEEAAGRIVTYLYEDLTDQRNGQRACALVRFYKTHPYGQLDAGRRRFASTLFAGEAVSPAAPCLALLATTGDEPAWSGVAGSRDHQAIPLDSAEKPVGVPMVIRLVTQLGIDLGASPPPSSSQTGALDLPPDNVFHIAEAAGSPDLPVQDAFVIRHRIRSVLGFGGLLPAGDLFAVVLFTKVPITAEARAFFKTLALAVKVSVMSFARGPIFS